MDDTTRRLDAMTARQRGARRLAATTMGIAAAGVVGSIGVAMALPGSTHSSAAASTDDGATVTTTYGGDDDAGTSTSSTTLQQATTPVQRSTGSGVATTGGS